MQAKPSAYSAMKAALDALDQIQISAHLAYLGTSCLQTSVKSAHKRVVHAMQVIHAQDACMVIIMICTQLFVKNVLP